jgi:hypothetical protein
VANSGVGDFLGIKTYNVTQRHLKKASELVRMAVGTMGLQLFDGKEQRPVETLQVRLGHIAALYYHSSTLYHIH